ncbi:hypothetical protein M0R45_038155 [Rubus argutus]|uniref:Uncharacterized protein n=1 Tax=Rubus argutus TaxID=59490 RepID=A0AAW1W278_RUBAR
MSNHNSVSDLGSCGTLTLPLYTLAYCNRSDIGFHILLLIFIAQVGNGVEHLIRIQKEHDELKAQFYKDRGALEAKYEKLYQALYDKRYNIVNAIGVTTDSETTTTIKRKRRYLIFGSML